MAEATEKEACSECKGRGYFVIDGEDGRGNHTQWEDPCEKCNPPKQDDGSDDGDSFRERE